MSILPANYSWLAHESGPKMLLEAIKLYGVIELPGAADSPTLLEWAKELGMGRIYTHDSIPWCGLFMATVAKRAGWELPVGPLWALNWAKWGTHAGVPMLGDVMTFQRHGGGHVAIYVAEDVTHYHIIGGNQGDRVCIERKAKEDLYEARRAPWRVVQPSNVRVVRVSSIGAPSGLSEE